MNDSVRSTYNAIITDPDYKQIPHPADSDIVALFRHRDERPPEYMAVTENGDHLHLRPGDGVLHGYTESMLKQAEANADAECDECGSDRLEFGTMDVGASTTMDLLTCPECGSTQQQP